MEKKDCIVYLGLSGFPYGMAAIQRQLIISKAISQNGLKVCIVCSRSTHSGEITVNKRGTFEGIDYFYLFDPFRGKSFIKRNIQRILIPVMEFLLLKEIGKVNKIKAAIISNRNLILNNIWYCFLSKLFGFKIVVNLVEDYSKREGRSAGRRVNDFFFDRIGLWFSNGYLPISHFLIEKNIGLRRKYFYLPVLVDPKPFINSIQKPENCLYFLYCGSASYFSSIEIILDAFSLVDRDEYKLMLITDGSEDELQRVYRLMEKLDISDRIQVKSKISYELLVSYYCGAVGLLLPMFQTVQDEARFPHKLGEYLASKRPVITNLVGELKYYLEDGRNVIVFNTNDSKSLAEKMVWLIENEEMGKRIGLEGFRVMEKHFNVDIVGEKLVDFLTNL